MLARGAIAALTMFIAAACTTAPANESKEPVYERPGIRNYEHISAVTTEHRESVFYERVTWANIHAWSDAWWWGQVSAWSGAYVASQVRQVAEHVQSYAPRSVPARSGGRDYSSISQCESGGNWSTNTGNGYYGGLQFSQSTWQSAGGTEYAPRADLASPEQQMAVADRIPRSSWPNC